MSIAIIIIVFFISPVFVALILCLILIKKNSENNFEKEELFDVKFVPLLDKSTQN